jgi:hypothetical protein
MRAPSVCRVAALVACLLFAAGSAAAQSAKSKKRTKKKPDDVVDIAAWKDKMVVFTDGEGGYFAAVPGELKLLFYGDGKTMHQQRVFGASRSGDRHDLRMWSPRVNSRADVRLDGDAGSLTCGKDTFDLVRVKAPEAARILDQAAFRTPLWKRQAHALSRDDRGTYYYVDRLRDEEGGKGFRLFAGPKGAVKQLPLTNIVSDSEGEIFASKSKGELRFVQSPRQATWIKGDKRTDLTLVPVEDNVALIYGELGVYEGSLGTPCDQY